MKRTDARVRYTRQVLKDSLLTLLEKKPVNRITVKEVCELAELNRATFYAHYSDCFDLLESIEHELLESFEQSMQTAGEGDTETLIEAIYAMIRKHERVCRVLVFSHPGSPVLSRMIETGREVSLARWREWLPGASGAELEMLYTHLSHGLLNVVMEGYDRYDREEVIRFSNRIVRSSLALFRETSKR